MGGRGRALLNINLLLLFLIKNINLTIVRYCALVAAISATLYVNSQLPLFSFFFIFSLGLDILFCRKVYRRMYMFPYWWIDRVKMYPHLCTIILLHVSIKYIYIYILLIIYIYIWTQKIFPKKFFFFLREENIFVLKRIYVHVLIYLFTVNLREKNTSSVKTKEILNK